MGRMAFTIVQSKGRVSFGLTWLHTIFFVNGLEGIEAPPDIGKHEAGMESDMSHDIQLDAVQCQALRDICRAFADGALAFLVEFRREDPMHPELFDKLD